MVFKKKIFLDMGHFFLFLFCFSFFLVCLIVFFLLCFLFEIYTTVIKNDLEYAWAARLHFLFFLYCMDKHM